RAMVADMTAAAKDVVTNAINFMATSSVGIQQHLSGDCRVFNPIGRGRASCWREDDRGARSPQATGLEWGTSLLLSHSHSSSLSDRVVRTSGDAAFDYHALCLIT